MSAYELRPPRTDQEWSSYHAIRRETLFERRGLGGRYDPGHPDEHAPGNHPLLLFLGDDPIGVIRVDVAPDRAIFRRVAIREEVQRAGHGRMLLALAERFARERGSARVESYVAPDAVAFYERCGFARLTDEPTAAGSVLMGKDLDE